MLEVRLEGLTLRVELIVLDFCDMYARARVMGFYIILRARRLNVGGPTGGTIGLLAHDSANSLGSISMTPEQRAGIHVELTTDNLDALYEHLKARGVFFSNPRTKSPGSVR